MMSNRFSDVLFQLIHSLEKSEKRNFKLYIKRNSSNEDLKIIRLFDAIDKLEEYNEKLLLKRLSPMEKPQLSNLKTHLYKQLLTSLRLLKTDDNIDLQLHEQFDFARILYNKGLYLQSLKILDKLKELSVTYNQDSFLIQVISLEKKIESLHITKSVNNRAEKLTAEAEQISLRRMKITRLSNLALQLYSWYIKNGHARNIEEEADIKSFFTSKIAEITEFPKGFYEQLYFYQSYSWYAFIRQDFLQYYRYTKKWVDLFYNQELMISVETGHFIKGMHNLLNAHFDLRNVKEFNKTLSLFERFALSEVANQHENFKIQTFVYLYSAKLNKHFMIGSFEEGIKMIPFIEEKINEYGMYIDNHRITVLQYKMATLYFGIGDYDTCINYLQKIIHLSDLRSNIHCYARLLHLMAHYELGNFELMETLTKSVYRLMAKMQNLTAVEEGMFKFLRNSFKHSPSKLKSSLENFLNDIKQYEKNRFETRSFAYLDVISWLESKMQNTTMSKIITEKYQANRRK